MRNEELSRWISYYLFYHGNRDQLLLDLVQPLVCRLWRSGSIDGFYFIRYGLGGPHVRLRLRCLPGCRQQVQHEVSAASGSFFQRWPSTVTLTEDEIRRTNRNLLANDPIGEDTVYPNDSAIEFPSHIEVQRYGGEPLLPHSLDFFTISSCHGLKFLRTYQASPKVKTLASALRILARLALGLASDHASFLDLLQYSLVWSQQDGILFVQRADQLFDTAPEASLQALQLEIQGLWEPGPDSHASESGPSLRTASRTLAREIAAATAPQRREIGIGQIHMTANRLGLLNPEEIYLGRLLWRAAREIAASAPELWQALGGWLATRENGTESLRDQAHASAQALC
jgi:hypothetical protein